jgi:hypothetical protein
MISKSRRPEDVIDALKATSDVQGHYSIAVKEFPLSSEPDGSFFLLIVEDGKVIVYQRFVPGSIDDYRENTVHLSTKVLGK